MSTDDVGDKNDSGPLTRQVKIFGMCIKVVEFQQKLYLELVLQMHNMFRSLRREQVYSMCQTMLATFTDRRDSPAVKEYLWE